VASADCMQINSIILETDNHAKPQQQCQSNEDKRTTTVLWPFICVFINTRRTADAPLHHRRSRISGSGFTCMEQPAVERHLVDVTDCF